jgi:hypothetical protein
MGFENAHGYARNAYDGFGLDFFREVKKKMAMNEQQV